MNTTRRHHEIQAVESAISVWGWLIPLVPLFARPAGEFIKRITRRGGDGRTITHTRKDGAQ